MGRLHSPPLPLLSAKFPSRGRQFTPPEALLGEEGHPHAAPPEESTLRRKGERAVMRTRYFAHVSHC